MTTNRELTERAGRAAGIVGRWAQIHQPYGGHWIEGLDTGARMYWSPLDDDGDAFRLAVKLNISTHQRFAMVQADFPRIEGICVTKTICEGVMNDYNKATRRVIVRAAAEMAQEMDL
ncbi:hypothetical protein GN109_05870 [Collimonas pratensis]|uniref:hypothetical protein n=1 Tax=Collimonas pratensis TaxID=279113 RepID=UPI00143D1DA5|nr:hypothetical protein [Collimonas pratensis]NKI68941.1 hypothetical protein [Collimonas pratensis]